MTASRSGELVYLQTAAGPVACFVHRPAASGPRRGAVLLCPPFGWDDVCSYRSRREWAAELAEAGYSALRIELPGTGDSAGSPRDTARLDAWVTAVADAARWLRDDAGGAQVTAIGIGLGGFVACLAAAGDAPITDVVLWGVSGRGRRLVRELRAFAQLKAAEFPDPDTPESPPLPDGGLEVAGFLITAETVAALEAVDLTAAAEPRLRPRRALLLGRDGVPTDERLGKALEAAGTEVSTLPGTGYGEMMENPQFARAPVVTIADVTTWLAAAPAAEEGGPAAPGAAPVVATPTMELETPGGGRVRESPFLIAQRVGRLLGVLSEPVDRPAGRLALVLLNGGAVRRIGPNRTWVEAARRWAAEGVTCLRVDIEGLGDSDGDTARYADTARLYDSELSKQMLTAVDALEARGLADRFALGGLCAGAFWAFHALVADERVRAAFMVNLWDFFWDDELFEARRAGRVRALKQRSAWKRVLRGEVKAHEVRAILRWAARTPLDARRRSVRRRNRNAEVEAALDRVAAAGKSAVLVFGRHEPLLEDFRREGRLERLDRWPGLEVQELESRDHTFRALWLQERVHALLDATVEHAITDPPPRGA